MIPDIELASPEEIKAHQEEKLKVLLVYLKRHSPFYQKWFEDHHIDTEAVGTLEDLKLLPTVSKDELQQYNDAFLCVPKSELIDYSTTSGTLGDPVTFGLTDGDLDRLAYNEMISFACAGVRKGDLVQMTTTMDRRFMAGLAYFLGLRALGAGVIRVGAGVPQLQWDSILQYRPQYLIAVPSFLLKLMEYAEKNDIDYRSSSITGAICIGEALKDHRFGWNALSRRIKDQWDIELYATYASTEMSAAFTECMQQQGGHQHPELIITEILNEEGQEAGEGELGELVITTLGIEGMPLLRYRTGDLLRKYNQPCTCGRNTPRLGPVEGRKQQMIKYKGTTLYPPAMQDVLSAIPEIKQFVIEITTNEIGTDELLVRIHSENRNEAFLQEVKDAFRARLRVSPAVQFDEEEVLLQIIHSPLHRKALTIWDKR